MGGRGWGNAGEPDADATQLQALASLNAPVVQDAGEQVQVSFRQLRGSFPHTISRLKEVQRKPRHPLQHARVSYKGRFRKVRLSCAAEVGCGKQVQQQE